MKLTATVITLGCRLNQADSALLTSRLQHLGYEIETTNSSNVLNLILVNSCNVTENAYRKSLQLLRSTRKENPQAYIVFTGCCADVYYDKLVNLDEIDLVLKNEDKKQLEKILPQHLANLKELKDELKTSSQKDIFFENAIGSFPFRSRAFVKVQEGCDNFCSYCIVPFTRGRERSRNDMEILDEIKQQLELGFREIVLTGVNICKYSSNDKRLPELLAEICNLQGNFRIRLSSTEPGDEVFDIINVMKEYPDKICPFFHLALQNGSDTILKAMNRHYTAEQYANYVEAARKAIPNIHIGTDLIIGFPGETDKLFHESLNFVKSMKFANIHLFPYSVREGTVAAELQKNTFPPKESVMERQGILTQIKEESAIEFSQSLAGTEGSVLFEISNKQDIWEGWSGNYVRTLARSKEDLSKKLLPVKFLRSLPSGVLVAEIKENEANKP